MENGLQFVTRFFSQSLELPLYKEILQILPKLKKNLVIQATVLYFASNCNLFTTPAPQKSITFTAVKIAFQESQRNGEPRCAGYIYYPNAKTPAPILIVGKYHKADPKVPNSESLYHMAFDEYQPDGEMTGKINLEYYEVEGDYTFKEEQDLDWVSLP